MMLHLVIAFLAGVILCYVYFWITLIRPSAYGVYYIYVDDNGKTHVCINLSSDSNSIDRANSAILYRTNNLSDIK